MYILSMIGTRKSSATCVVDKSKCRKAGNGIGRAKPVEEEEGGISVKADRRLRRGSRKVRWVSWAPTGESASRVRQASWKKTCAATGKSG